MPFTGAGTNISNADDVFFSTYAQGHVLRYNSTTSKWNNTALSVSSTELANDSVTESKLAVSNSPSNNQFLRWNGTALEWSALAYEPTVTAGTTAQYYRGDKTWQTLDKTAVGLANADNTSDAAKPISTATQTALNLKVDETISVSGGTSLTGGGALTSNRTITLLNDSATPGNSMYYGTNGSGTKGFYSIPASDPTLGGDLTGTASAAQIAANAVGSAEIANNAVGTTELADGSVTEPKLAVSNAPSTNQVLSWDGSAMTWTAPSGGGSLEVRDEGTTLTAAATSINFTGSNVTASNSGSNVTVSVSSGSGRLGEVEVASFAGATYSDKFRAALSWASSQNPKPALIMTPGSTIDAGNTPFLIPAGVSIVGSAGVQTEFGHNCPINVRHTGGTAVFQTSTRGTNENNCKGWSMRSLAFEGTGSQVLFADNPFDGSASIWAYNTLDNVCADLLNRVYWGPMLGVTITGTTYYNNMQNTAWYITGSDNCLWTDGAFFEMGTTVSYATRAALPAMVRCGSLAKTVFGPMYLTGSPTTAFRLDGGEGGVALDNLTLEGRPVPGGGPDYLWCAGEIMRLTGGRSVHRNKWYAYAMRDAAATGRASEGYIHITGGEHLIDGGTVQYYSSQSASPPPFIRITGGLVVVRNIIKGPNTTAKPVVLTTNANFVDADSTVTVTVG